MADVERNPLATAHMGVVHRSRKLRTDAFALPANIVGNHGLWWSLPVVDKLRTNHRVDTRRSLGRRAHKPHSSPSTQKAALAHRTVGNLDNARVVRIGRGIIRVEHQDHLGIRTLEFRFEGCDDVRRERIVVLVGGGLASGPSHSKRASFNPGHLTSDLLAID